MKAISLEELKEKNYGPIGSKKRDQLEQELKMELLKEELLQLKKLKKAGDSI
jgi:hypothetical protein